jgi:hypothetical protein
MRCGQQCVCAQHRYAHMQGSLCNIKQLQTAAIPPSAGCSAATTLVVPLRPHHTAPLCRTPRTDLNRESMTGRRQDFRTFSKPAHLLVDLRVAVLVQVCQHCSQGLHISHVGHHALQHSSAHHTQRQTRTQTLQPSPEDTFFGGKAAVSPGA